MPLEPNRKMDDLLKACAEQRRERAGAPLELHPATRKMLQDEVARTFGKAEPAPSRWKIIFGSWPRLAFGGAAFAGLAALMIFIFLEKPTPLGSEKSRTLASAGENSEKHRALVKRILPETAQEKDFAKTAETPLAAAPSSSTVVVTNFTTATDKFKNSPADLDGLALANRRNESKTVSSDRYGIAPAAAASAPPPVAEDTITFSGQIASTKAEKQKSLAARSSSTNTFLALKNEALSDVPATGAGGRLDDKKTPAAPLFAGRNAHSSLVASPAPTTVQPSGQLAKNDGGLLSPSRKLDLDLATRAADTRANFVQLDSRSQYRLNVLSPPLPKVLASFQFERSGQKIRILDGDGSVYEGEIVNPMATFAAKTPGGSSGILEGKTPARTRGSSEGRKKSEINKPISGGANETISFRVSGMNKKLNQPIIFNGALLAGNETTLNGFTATNGLRTDSPAALNRKKEIHPAAAGGKISGKDEFNFDLAQPSTRINGRVQIGRKTEFEINAAQTAP